jgi:hypothetical protein
VRFDADLHSRADTRGDRRGKQDRDTKELVHGSNEAMEDNFTL